MRTHEAVEYVAGEIRAGLARHRMSQLDLAAAIGINPSGLSRRLTGKREFTLTELIRAAEFLGVDLQDLIATTTRRAS